MGSGDYLAKVKQGLLSHRKMHQIRLEPIQLPGKGYLVQRVEGKLPKPAGDGMEAFAFYLPIVIWLDQNYVLVGFIYILEVFD
jgi:hypothetical protein